MRGSARFLRAAGVSAGLLIAPGANPAAEVPLGVPADIVSKAEALIRSRTGDAMFERAIRFVPGQSQLHPASEWCGQNPGKCGRSDLEGYYRLEFRFHVPESPWVDVVLVVPLDRDGKELPDNEPFGIPGCLARPGDCVFPIDEIRVAAIAAADGLEAGMTPWKPRLYWYGGEIRRYVWGIYNTLVDSEDGAEGNGRVIDANTGVVLFRHSWFESRCLVAN